MGIELELHFEPSRWTESEAWEASRATLLQGSYDHGEALAQVLALGRDSPGRSSG